jgi:hypothetical protein
MNSRLVVRVHTDGTWACSRRTDRKRSLEHKEQAVQMPATKRTLIFFWRQVMQPVLLRVYFGRLR